VAVHSRAFYSMRSFLWKNRWLFLLGTLAGWGLRGYLLKHYSLIQGDSLIYGEIAKNWLQSGIFGLGECGEIVPTVIRLPGYPAFLAAIFRIFGMEHYTAVLRAQLVVDLVTCFLIAETARRAISERAGKIAFLLAVLCPFTAIYCAAPLSETLSVFAAASALLAAVCAFGQPSKWRYWFFSGAAVAMAILLRPDGGVLLAAILLYAAWRFLQRRYRSRKQLLTGSVILAVVALAPLVPWTVRNWRVFHTFQPLAPRYANAPGEFVPMGFNRWMRTWCVEFVCTNDVYWKVSADTQGEQVNFNSIPHRAFDTPQQEEQTRMLIDDYNSSSLLTPELDTRFELLAQERVQHSRFRYYIWLPFLRVLDMWMRPRTEMLNLDLDWWRFEDTRESLNSLALAVLNALYLACAVLGLRRAAGVRFVGLFVAFIALRSLMLASLENPEPRYTLECLPAVMVLAAAGIAGIARGWSRYPLEEEGL
jgi:4-amino-4-deoxy-L-arabinose transferase-like glycosyltransferase